MTVFQPRNTETPSRTLSEPARVVRLPDPALALLIELRGDGYGWEDCCVILQQKGLLVSKRDVRRFILGPKITAPSQDESDEGARGFSTHN